MSNQGTLKPGKRENAFTIQTTVVDKDKVGVQSANSQMYCASVWDPVQRKYMNKVVKRNEFDKLG